MDHLLFFSMFNEDKGVEEEIDVDAEDVDSDEFKDALNLDEDEEDEHFDYLRQNIEGPKVEDTFALVRDAKVNEEEAATDPINEERTYLGDTIKLSPGFEENQDVGFIEFNEEDIRNNDVGSPQCSNEGARVK